MSNLHSCVLTQSEIFWRQHGENLRRNSSQQDPTRTCLLLSLQSETVLTAKKDIFQANDEIAEIRQSVVKDLAQAADFVGMMTAQMKMLEPILGRVSHKIEEISSTHGRLEAEKTVLHSLLEKHTMIVELLATSMKQFETISEITSQCAYVAERVEMDCKILQDDQNFMDNLEDGEAAPRQKSVAAQFDHDELLDPALFCLKAAKEIVATNNVELITLMLRFILETCRTLMGSTRESYPVMQEAFQDIREKYVKAFDEREIARIAEEKAALRRNSFSVVK